jgi:ankyrin repeat protein
MADNAEELGLRLLALCKERGNAPSIAEMQSLIAKGANVNTKGAYGWSVLNKAVFFGYLNAVLLLLATEGIDICAKSNIKYTALMFACMNGNVEIVEALLAALKKTPNFDINDTNHLGRTALMFACMHDHVQIVKILLSIPRINTNLKSNLGETALDLAKGGTKGDEIKALFQGELLSSSALDKQCLLFPLILSLAHNISLISSLSIALFTPIMLSFKLAAFFLSQLTRTDI